MHERARRKGLLRGLTLWMNTLPCYVPVPCLRFANMMLGGIKVPKPVILAAAAVGTGALYYAFRSKL